MRNRKTVWGSPTETLKSQYGEITYADWCEKEKDRFESKGGKYAVESHKGKVALYRVG